MKAYILLALAAGLCLAVPFGLPREYYQAVRFIVTLSAFLLAWRAFQDDRPGWGWTFAALLILFNPIIPIAMDRDGWPLLYWGAALLLVLGAWRVLFAWHSMPKPRLKRGRGRRVPPAPPNAGLDEPGHSPEEIERGEDRQGRKALFRAED